MSILALDITAPRGLVYRTEDGAIGVVTNLIDNAGRDTRDPLQAATAVVFLGEGSWMAVKVDPVKLSNSLPEGNA